VCRAQAAPPALRPVLDRLDSAITSRSASGRFSGVALVARLDGHGGEVLYSRAAGVADRSSELPVTMATRFVTASVAKAFTAVAVMQLVDSGRLRLDTPMGQQLRANVLPPEHPAVTPSQLLTHTAGIADVVTSPAFRRSPGSLTTFDQLIGLVRADTTTLTPGVFRYGDGDYIVLGALVQQISAQSFASYVADHVFRPSGMTASTYVLTPRPSDVAHGYTTRNLAGPTYARPGRDSEPPLHANDGILPGVGVPGSVAYTTATDLMRFADALLAHRLLSDSATNQLWSAHVQTGQERTNPANASYGYGFFVGRLGSDRIVNHGGTGPGIDNAFDIYPDLHIAVIILANLDAPAAQDLRQLVRDGIASRPTTDDRRPATDDRRPTTGERRALIPNAE
jgi:CubicO group peptidase (beta-lactamase class C family)